MFDDDQDLFEIDSDLDYYRPYLPEYKLLAAILVRGLLDLSSGDRHLAWLAVEWFEGAPSDGFNYEDIVSGLNIGLRYQLRVRAFVMSAKKGLQYQRGRVIVAEFTSKESPCQENLRKLT